MERRASWSQTQAPGWIMETFTETENSGGGAGLGGREAGGGYICAV